MTFHTGPHNQAVRGADRNELLTAWAAGLFEGEGSIYVDRTDRRKGRGKPVLQMSLVTTDYDVICKFNEVVGGGGVVNGPYWQKRSTKPCWKWHLRIADDVRVVASRFSPYLGARRLEQIDNALRIKDEADAEYRPLKPGPRPGARRITGQMGFKC